MINTVLLVGSRDRQLEDILRGVAAQVSPASVADLTRMTISAATVPDVIVLDVRQGGGVPVACATFRRQHPEVGIVIVATALDPALLLDAMRAGVNLVCADRVGESIIPNLSVRENFFLNPLAAGQKAYTYLAPAPEGDAARQLGSQVGLRPNDPDIAIELLSGGNQQKVVVGRWLHLASKVYIFEDPTAGVDVGAKAEIYRLFDVVLHDGAVIIISSIAGLRGSPAIGAYAVSKAADMQLVRNLAVEWGRFNIRVNAIAPGLIKTDFARALWENPELREITLQQTPLQRPPDPTPPA